jgi:hypothetical protein
MMVHARTTWTARQRSWADCAEALCLCLPVYRKWVGVMTGCQMG